VNEKELISRLHSIAVVLYSGDIASIWKRAGGDASVLFLSQPARDAWYDALEELRRGGGGAEITLASLIAMMLSDYPKNNELRELHSMINGGEEATRLSESSLMTFSVNEQPWYLDAFPEFRNAGQAPAELRQRVRVAIVTVTDVELRYAASMLDPPLNEEMIVKVTSENETYFLGRIRGHEAVLTKCRMGAVGVGAASLATEELLRLWEPKAAFMVGIAFGKDSVKQHIGQVLIADAIVPYEPQRVGATSVRRGITLDSDHSLLNRFENAHDWAFEMPDGSRCRKSIGQILSGEKLIDDPDIKKGLFLEFPSAIGGEMEGAGFYAAARRRGVPCLLVKSICDWADGSKNDLYQPLAAATSVSFLAHVLAATERF